MTADQDDILAFLADPATHGGANVTRIDTHSASVFLTGERVLKVKRAVKFPFLDYSTLDKRRAACEAEIEVNRPFAPHIYRGVSVVFRNADGKLAIGDAGAPAQGEPVEYAVDMTRFDESRTLDKLPASEMTDRLADALGAAVAAAHHKTPQADTAAWLDEIATIIKGNDSELRAPPAEFGDAVFPAARIDALTTASRAAAGRHEILLRRRGAEGFVRRGHGDLHLGNIALIDGAPVLFDALEFDAALASGDVFYDLAFLLMDLIARGLRRQANIVLNRYVAVFDDDGTRDALAALPLFLSMRAAIRAKVTLARAARADGDKRAKAKDDALAYFDLACALIAPKPPCIVATGGLSGTGKSVLARDIAPGIGPEPGALIVRTDVVRKALFGVGETDRLPADAYTAQVTEKVYAAVAERCARIARAGHGAIADAVFAHPRERTLIEQAAAQAGVAFTGLMLEADIDTRVARVGGRKGDASDADAKIARQQEDYDIGPCDWARVDATGTPDDTAARARQALAAAKVR